MTTLLRTNPRALIVFNPVAGQSSTMEDDLFAACEVWRSGGWIVELRPTAAPGDGAQIARTAAAEGYDIVVAAGGDGTVNEVINGLVGTRTALATLPIGTVNVWARELGMPLQPRAAAEALLTANVQQIDLGKAGDHYFLLMAGIGFDAAVTAEVRPHEKRRLGVLAYAVRAMLLATRFLGARTRITLDGRVIRSRILMIVIGNSQLYGGFVKLTARANMNDGLLDVCVIKGKSLRGAPWRIFSVVTRRYNRDPEVEYHRSRSIKIEANPPLPVQIDGDPIGHTPMVFEAVPNALCALIPATATPDLLRPAPPRSRRALQRIFGWFSRRRAQARTTSNATSNGTAEHETKQEVIERR
jgi:YegS/Rv2252/BmrU family lipid kinase